MSKRRDVEERVRVLGEIEGIMGAMKNLALMESMKLGRVLAAQHRVVENIETAGKDFLNCYPELTPGLSGTGLYLVVGTERGFCGDFNDRVLSALERHLEHAEEKDPVLILVGRKLVERTEKTYRISAVVEGPTVAEDVPSLLIRVIDQIRATSARHGLGGQMPVTVVYHDAVNDAVVVRPLRPFDPSGVGRTRSLAAPVLTLPPAKFFGQLVDLYLFSLLHAIFYSALMAECRARLAHLESAQHRLAENRDDLIRRRNVMRQEEITEEIEVLMLSADDATLFR